MSDVDDETRGLLQSRLSLVFTVLASVALFYALSHALTALFGQQATAPSSVPLTTLAIGACNAVLALLCRAGQRSFGQLRALDAGATAITCWTIAVSFTQIQPANEASVSLQLSLTYVLMARAVLLPSSGWFTLAVSVASVVPGGVLATQFRVEALSHAPASPDWLTHGYVVFRNLGVTTFLSTLTSKVIYGLRRQVREQARIGQYLLREKIGEGGMGVVYRATHTLLRRDTAVKLILPERVGSDALLRFEREVRLTAQLTHLNTVAIFDYGRASDGTLYYAMEHLEGGDLEQLVAYAGPLEPGRVIWILEQACRALSEAHELGLIHRDIKPSNILVCERGLEGDIAKVLDFGLVKDLKDTDSVDAVLAGTPLYLAPESITAPGEVDARVDLYSLAAVGYFLLVGEPVFRGRSVVEVCSSHLHELPQAPSAHRPGLPSELDDAILRCLQKQPDDRFASARELRQALLACPAAATWTADSAARWWSAHRTPFRAQCEAARRRRLGAAPPVANQGATLQIDLERRGP
jgi:serine/threonine-protein kinase